MVYYISKKRKIYYRKKIIGYEVLSVETNQRIINDPNVFSVKNNKNIDPELYYWNIKDETFYEKTNEHLTSKYVTRQTTVTKLFEKIYPNHHVIWIDDYLSYYYISTYLREKTKKDVVILQTEEDFFHHFHLKDLRKKIKNDPNWTENSFIITNSYKDYLVSKKIIRTEFKPGILDLLAYKSYIRKHYPLAISDIKYHTGFLYQVERPARKPIFDLLMNYSEKLSYVVWGQHQKIWVNNIDNRYCSFPLDSGATVFNAPYLEIGRDYEWTKHSAFIISVETYHHGTKSAKVNNKNYAPTLSEKTFKAMHLLRPALVFGGPGTREYLKHFGFDTWDWLIDWSFDYETDYKKSLMLYGKELKRLLDTDIFAIRKKLEQNQDALLYNRRRIFELVKNYRYI